MLGLSLQYLKFTGHLSRMLGDQLLTLKMSLKKKRYLFAFPIQIVSQGNRMVDEGMFLFQKYSSGGVWVAQPVKLLPLAQVLVLGQSPTGGSLLSREPVLPLTAAPPAVLSDK